MNAFPMLVENEALRERLSLDIRRRTLSHAYLIEGGYGCGKRTLAEGIAMALACERRDDGSASFPCMECSSCKKIRAGNSPDVIAIRRPEDRATMGVDVIRRLRADVLTPPNELETKTYVLEDAHLMTEDAQNAFLLTLEEPPPYVLFLLLCNTTEPMLETVRSRAPTLRLSPVSGEAQREYLLATSREAAALHREAPEELMEILATSQGSIGRALELLDPQKRKPILTMRANARRFCELCSARRDSAAAVRFLSSLPQKRDGLTEQLHTVLLCLRDLLLLKQTEDAPLCFFPDREEAWNTAYAFTTPELLRLCDCVTQAIEALDRSANVTLTLGKLATDTRLLPFNI